MAAGSFAPDPEISRARYAVGALFLTNGALFANLVPRYPGIKADLALTNAGYGLAVAALPAGAVVAGLAAATIIRRIGSARTAVFATVLVAVGACLVGLASSVVWFAGAMFLAGAADSIADVGQNVHGLRVQRGYGRSIIHSFHAIWSVGAVLGGLMGAGALALGIPRAVHLAVIAVGFSVAALVALRFCLQGPDDGPVGGGTAGTGPSVPPRLRVRTLAVLVALVVIGNAGSLVEDAGSTWAAVYLGVSLGAPAAVAAYGFVALVGAQFVGRVIGDRLVDRFGQRAVARAGGAIVVVGMGLALAFPTVAGTIAGFAAAGFGVATLVPAALHEADELPGLRPGTGITVVSWLLRLGFLVSPPIVGLVADTASLRLGLLVVPLAGAAVVVLAGVLSPKVTR